ncbi:MAG: hypothetical protein Q9M28_10915, partial [Mariprofundaceae bacterium]|nr:hypothetical protein [Mariprofundaceae bacterium]
FTGHLLFALKHENLNLGILKALFNTCDAEELERWISDNPQGVQTRRAWFLYEWLTGSEPKSPSGQLCFIFMCKNTTQKLKKIAFYLFFTRKTRYTHSMIMVI